LRWGREKSLAMDGGQGNRHREDWQKCKKKKKHKNKQKNNTAKHQNKYRDEGGRGRGKETGGTKSRDIK
jgi:hypothetical protein